MISIFRFKSKLLFWSFQLDLNPKYLLSSIYLGNAYKAFGEQEKGDEILNRVYDLDPQLKQQFVK